MKKMKDHYLHHVAMWRGYISRKTKSSDPIPYKGRFGEGFVVYKPNPRSTRYSFIEYWIHE